MSAKPTLKLDWCSHAAAKYAVEHWHYSKSLRIFPNISLGVWEADTFVGALVFARGANKNLGKPYGLQDIECAELTRVALSHHNHPVSRMLSIAITMVKQKEKGLRLIVSFADMNQGHHGGIYQAAGWVYAGKVQSAPKYLFSDGATKHPREVSATGWKPYFGKSRHVRKIADAKKIAQLPKYRYLYPLDAAMRTQIAPLAKPYPKRATSILVDALADQAGEGGANPTVALLARDRKRVKYGTGKKADSLAN